ncbi:MAG TPA: hypothetical protein VGO43_01860 [Pyrinomonadaceae bacterium]|jgi:hypothetical protein|nr:hypothetical protein [Pyrinomonadaceae bacterium]
MFALFEITGTVEALFVSIPESLGLLAFGVGLITMAVMARRLFNRAEQKNEEGASPKA